MGRGKKRQRRFAAAPHERVHWPWVTSTLFPQLPRRSLRTFRTALLIGIALVVALGAAGLYPVALVASVVITPLLVVLYVYDVDVYEDEPLLVIGLTMVAGAAAGIGLGLVDDVLIPEAAGLLAESTERRIAVGGVLLPLISAVLMLAGPLVLLPYRRFNDVLDGATFGAASAVAFVGALALTESESLFAAGLRPTGEPWPWVPRLLAQGTALPLLAAGAIGGACASLWLRYRAPARDRLALDRLGHPVVALSVTAAVLVAAAVAQIVLGRVTALLVLLGLAALAVIWLRHVIHVGLRQESAEIAVGPGIDCTNCSEPTPSHSFCGRCGVSLRALPKRRKAWDAHDAQPGLLRFRPETLLGVFAVCLVLAVAAAAGAANVGAGAPSSEAHCGALRDCGPPAGSPPADARAWRSSLGFRVEYDPTRWRDIGRGTRDLRLRGPRDEVLTITGRRDAPVADLLGHQVSKLRKDLADLERNDDPSHKILSPSIGDRDGLGATYCGTATTPQGGNAIVDVVLLAAKRQDVGVVVSLVTDSCNASWQELSSFVRADAILNTFRWPAEGGSGR